MSDDVIISVENLFKAYRLYEKPLDRLKESLDPWKRRYSKDFYALNDVNFKIYRGETIGIVGKNGAGKSTLLKILTGVLTPSAGKVTIKGKISALLELGAGFNPEMTGLENIYLNGTIMGYSREAIDLKIADILEFADIGEFINQPVKMYSSGMFARLAFAVSVNVDPEILIVDEALAVGDKRFQIKCMNKMKKMMEGGTTVLFVSHDSNAIRRFCSRALWFHQGRLMACGETNRVVDQYLEYNNCGVNLMVQNRRKAAKNKIPQQPENSIAQIIDFRVLNKAGEEVAEADFNEALTVEVAYRVFDEAIEKPVLGVALYSVDDEYICGLNTLLDNYSIPWRRGENRVRLEYPLGLRTISGRYYFDTALFEETATVSIQYISRVEEITVVSEYVGEGKLIIPHSWSG